MAPVRPLHCGERYGVAAIKMSSLKFVYESFTTTNGENISLSHATSTPTPSSFEFVTFSDPDNMRDAKAKSQIRKHAMKDIGALRRRPNKRRRGYVSMPMDFRPEGFVPNPASTSVSYGGVDPFLCYPIELDQDAKRLVANSTSAPVSDRCMSSLY